MNKKLRRALSWKGEPLTTFCDRHGTPSFSFVSEKFRNSSDLETLGFDDDTCIFMHDKFTWANIVSTIGLFASAGIARKSGFDEVIEEGFSEAFFTRSDGTPLFVFILK